ncbi:MAG: MTH1187 family thiamine-binding protein [Candidatus Eisenbacteria bacterium]|nr:MTH1187 family thiamine-binding protein [Candidatus Eisenbacteria bacterium]
MDETRGTTPPTHREVLLEFSMTPLDKGASVSRYVARSLDIIDRSGVPYRMNPMGTVLEGSWEEVWRVVTACFERMREDCERISVAVKIDYRAGRSDALRAKIASVQKHLGRDVAQS